MGNLYDELLTDDMPYKPDIFHRKMEEIAYTWFNRLIALRFMGIDDYLLSGIRILSSKDLGRIEPDDLPYVDTARLLIILITDTPAIDKIVEESIKLSQTDWDSFGTSWDFQSHPLIAARMQCKEQERIICTRSKTNTPSRLSDCRCLPPKQRTAGKRQQVVKR